LIIANKITVFSFVFIVIGIVIVTQSIVTQRKQNTLLLKNETNLLLDNQAHYVERMMIEKEIT